MQRLDARTRANRENARKSTGPKSEAGKVRSRANAFQHGLTGQGVAWPEEDQAALDRFVAEFVRLERPQDEHEVWLVSRSAVLAWKIERGERLEAANAHVRASTGRRRLLDSREREREHLVAQLEVDPRTSVRALLRSAHGCEWFADALYELLDLLEQGQLAPEHVARIDALCGPNQPGMFRPSRARMLATAVASLDTSALYPRGLPGVEPMRPDANETDRISRENRIKQEFLPTWTAELRSILERRIEEVEGRLADLAGEPDAELELADVLAAFDESPLGERLRRYVRGLVRERKAILQELADWRAARPRREERPEASVPASPAPEAPVRPANDRTQPVLRQDVPANWVCFEIPTSGRSGGAPEGVSGPLAAAVCG